MTTSTKTSTALLVAWFVLLAGLIGSIVFFVLKGRTPAPEPDVPVVPVPTKTVKPPESRTPTRPSRHPTNAPTVPPKEPQILGVVKGPDDHAVAGAHIGIFALSAAKTGAPSSAPNMDDIKDLNQIIYLPPEEWDAPRPLDKWTGGADDNSRAEGTELASAESKDDGTFLIKLTAAIGGGPFRLAASKADVGSASIAEVKADGPPLDILLGPAASLTGKVITEVDSVPVEGARVVFDSGSRRVSAQTGPGGRFDIEGVTPGRYEISVAAKGKTPLFDPNYSVTASAFTVPMTLVMPRGTTLRVKAIVEKPDQAPAAGKGGADGDPVPNAKIAAYCEDTGIYVLGRTNAEGLVEFAGMPAGRYSLNGMATGFVSAGEEQIVIDRNQLNQDQTVSFEPAVDTPVEVVDEDGRPVAGVDFYTVNADEKYDSLRSMKVGTTDTDGKMKYPFEFDGPRCALFGFKTGYALVRAYPDDNSSGDPIKLVAKKPVSVHGVVKTTDGRPIPDTIVAIDISPEDNTADDMQLEIRADRDGKYQFAYLPRTGGITISATAPDGVSQEDQDLELVEGQSDYTVDLLIEFEEPVTPKANAPTKHKGMQPNVTPPQPNAPPAPPKAPPVPPK